MSRKPRSLKSIRISFCWGGGVLPLVAASAMAIDPPPTVGPNVRVNDPLGADGADFPGPLIDCLNSPDCDDDPKSQNETAITVAPWDSTLLIAAWNDFSRRYLNQEGNQAGLHGIGFAISERPGKHLATLRSGTQPLRHDVQSLRSHGAARLLC